MPVPVAAGLPIGPQARDAVGVPLHGLAPRAVVTSVVALTPFHGGLGIPGRATGGTAMAAPAIVSTLTVPAPAAALGRRRGPFGPAPAPAA